MGLASYISLRLEPDSPQLLLSLQSVVSYAEVAEYAQSDQKLHRGKILEWR